MVIVGRDPSSKEGRNHGRWSLTASSSPSCPFSISESAVAETTGLVRLAIRNRLSRVTFVPASRSAYPRSAL